MRRQGQVFARGERVGKLQVAGLAIDGLAHQRLIGKAHHDIAGERRDGRVRPVDLAIGPDRLDAVEVVGIINIGRDHVADIGTIACDRAVKMAKALQRDVGWRTCHSGCANRLPLCHDTGRGGQEPRACHLPVETVDHAA